MNSKFPKIFLFILSIAPFFIMLGLMTMDIPISFDKESRFIGWKALWHNSYVGLSIIVISGIIELSIYCLFKRVCNTVTKEHSEQVKSIKNRNFELISFATSVFLPLISFQYNQLSHWLATVFIVIIIGYIFCSSDGYFTNPTLAIFGYKLYDVELCSKSNGNTLRNITIISDSSLTEESTVRCYKLSDNVSYAELIKNNEN